MEDEQNDALDALSPERFYWVSQAVCVAMIVIVFSLLTIAAHLVGEPNVAEMTEAQSLPL